MSAEVFVDEAWEDGYREGYLEGRAAAQPRIVETADELDALPEGTEIVDRYERLTLQEDVNGYHEWHDIHGNVCSVELPATVLSAPEATA